MFTFYLVIQALLKIGEYIFYSLNFQNKGDSVPIEQMAFFQDLSLTDTSQKTIPYSQFSQSIFSQ